jgi:hypothetical protein
VDDGGNRTPPHIWEQAKRAADVVFLNALARHQFNKRVVRERQREERKQRDKQNADALRRERMRVFWELLQRVRMGNHFDDVLMISGMMDLSLHLSQTLSTRERRRLQQQLRELGLTMVSK